LTTWIAFSAVDGHVDVHPEDQLAAGDVLHLVDEVVVPVARRDPLPLEQAERMRPGRADAEALLRRDRVTYARSAAARARRRPASGRPGVVISITDCISSG
jgi:hypothetical protein